MAAYPSPCGPGRHNYAGYAESCADRKSSNELMRCTTGRHRRHYVIEDAIVLVVVENKNGFCPYVGICGNRVDLAGDKRRSIGRHVVRMLRLITGRDDPGDRRQLVIDRVVLELALRAAHHALVIKRRSFSRVPENFEG